MVSQRDGKAPKKEASFGDFLEVILERPQKNANLRSVFHNTSLFVA